MRAMNQTLNQPSYSPRRVARSVFLPLRGQRYHVHVWGDASLAGPQTPPLVMVHGWMDVGASYQFVVDALKHERLVLAPDWRGFGLTEGPAADSYWFPDYLGDLDALLDATELGLAPDMAVDLVGHSMGGNVVMSYAGVRPERIRKLINLEGFGLPETRPHHAPKRLAKWLDELKTPQRLRTYDTIEAVAERMRSNNPRLSADKAAWLAPHWSRLAEDGQWHIQGDPAHKRTNPVLYRKDEVLEGWKLIEAPTLWVEGADTDIAKYWGGRYSRAEFQTRIELVPKLQQLKLDYCGHMLHHDQPQALAAAIEAFLQAD
jgi:pimeloyl-ACP methyl ester carboxylesterase